MMKGILPGLVLIAVLTTMIPASAETFTTSGTTGDGEYVATLYLDDSGNAALAFAGVQGGTLTPADQELSDCSSCGGLEQEYTLEAANGQGFAGISAIDSGNNQASTATTLTNGQATVFQSVGWESFFLPGNVRRDVFEDSVFAMQMVEGDAEYLRAGTEAVSADGDSAWVDTTMSGSLSFLTQVAGSMTAIPVVGGWYYGDTFADQYGALGADNLFGTPTGGQSGVAWASVSAGARDSSGSSAGVGAAVGNGILLFDQFAGVMNIPSTDAFGIPAFGVFAYQEGQIEGAGPWNAYSRNEIFGADYGSATAFSSDPSGNTVNVVAAVRNGTLEFDQISLSGGATIEPLGILSASQQVEVAGTDGMVGAYASNAEGSVLSEVSSEFHNQATTGSVNFGIPVPGIGGMDAEAESTLLSIFGDTMTDANLDQESWGDLQDFTITGRTYNVLITVPIPPGASYSGARAESVPGMEQVQIYYHS